MIDTIMMVWGLSVMMLIVFVLGLHRGFRWGERSAVEHPVDTVERIKREDFKRELKDIKKTLKIR